MKARVKWIAVLSVVVFAVGCSTYDPSDGYLPPDLSGDTSGLTIADVPLDQGGSIRSDLPDQGRYLGFVFGAQDNEVYDITLERLTGTDVPALALYHFDNDTWSDPLAWATADAREIGIYGWEVPGTGTYLALVEVVAGPGDGDFLLTLRCVEGCENPVMCETDADCPENQVCWNQQCFDFGIECRMDADCPAGEICENGFCVVICDPMPEICDGIDNDCDGLVDEDCERPCTSSADCLIYEVCINGQCVAECNCASDPDCAVGYYCVDCLCLPERCASDEDCGPDQSCVNGECITLPCGEGENCPPGQACCEGVCVDVLNDPANCGTCGAACAAGEICLRGMCTPAGCTSHEECDDGNPGTIDLCENGICYNRPFCQADSDCPAGQMCVNGICVDDSCTDMDQDGFLSCEGDCNDQDASIHPAAPETCDGLDNDCDGMVDEGCEEPCGPDGGVCAEGQACCEGFCADVLFDVNNCGGCGQVCAAGEACIRGQCVADICASDADCDDGDPMTGDYCYNGQCYHEFWCTSDADCPAGQLCIDGLCMYDPCPDDDADGWCTCDGDCNDQDPSVHPQAEEICDEIDNNCNGIVDEGCNQECVSDADCPPGQFCESGMCFNDPCPDDDQDGYSTCDDDCNDHDASIHPAAPEICDELDNDCDGIVDEGCNEECVSDADCDDGNPQTEDYCLNGVCVHR